MHSTRISSSSLPHESKLRGTALRITPRGGVDHPLEAHGGRGGVPGDAHYTHTPMDRSIDGSVGPGGGYAECKSSEPGQDPRPPPQQHAHVAVEMRTAHARANGAEDNGQEAAHDAPAETQEHVIDVERGEAWENMRVRLCALPSGRFKKDLMRAVNAFPAEKQDRVSGASMDTFIAVAELIAQSHECVSVALTNGFTARALHRALHALVLVHQQQQPQPSPRDAHNHTPILSLDLTSSSLQDRGAALIARALPSTLTHVHTLILKDCGLMGAFGYSHSEPRGGGPGSGGMVNFVKQVLCMANPARKGFHLLCEAIGNHQCMTALDVSDNNIGRFLDPSSQKWCYDHPAIQTLAQALRCSTLTHLSLRKNSLCGTSTLYTGAFTDVGLRLLTTRIQELPLVSLDVTACALGAQGMALVCEALPETLTQLYMSHNRTTTTVESNIGSTHVFIEPQLEPPHNIDGEQVLPCFEAMLFGSDDDEVLALQLVEETKDNGSIGADDGDARLSARTLLLGAVQWISALNTVQVLHVSDCGLGYDVCETVLRICTSVTDLDLSFNQIGAPPLAVRQADPSLSQWNGASSSSPRYAAFRAYSGLPAFDDFLEALAQNTALVSLNIASNNLPVALLSRIVAGVPRNIAHLSLAENGYFIPCDVPLDPLPKSREHCAALMRALYVPKASHALRLVDLSGMGLLEVLETLSREYGPFHLPPPRVVDRIHAAMHRRQALGAARVATAPRQRLSNSSANSSGSSTSISDSDGSSDSTSSEDEGQDEPGGGVVVATKDDRTLMREVTRASADYRRNALLHYEVSCDELTAVHMELDYKRMHRGTAKPRDEMSPEERLRALRMSCMLPKAPRPVLSARNRHQPPGTILGNMGGARPGPSRFEQLRRMGLSQPSAPQEDQSGWEWPSPTTAWEAVLRHSVAHSSLGFMPLPVECRHVLCLLREREKRRRGAFMFFNNRLMAQVFRYCEEPRRIKFVPDRPGKQSGDGMVTSDTELLGQRVRG